MKNIIFKKEKLPIVFSKEYNVQFCGLQCAYPYDTTKGQNVLNYLKDLNFVTDDIITAPMEIQVEELCEVHTERYIDSLKMSETVSRIAEIPLLYFIPNIMVQDSYLKPMRFQTAGTILAAKLACREGWAINLGGGFHHCCSDKGGSFSPYADISLAVKFLLTSNKLRINKVMIVDLAARQGYGHERDFSDIPNIYILDMYNESLHNKDDQAKQGISKKVELKTHTADEVYLRKLRIYLGLACKDFRPDIIIYNAGTDILDGDRLGELCISPKGIITRDEYVFNKARELKIPIVMLLSMGYSKHSAAIIAHSIINLKEQGLIPHKLWPLTEKLKNSDDFEIHEKSEMIY